MDEPHVRVFAGRSNAGAGRIGPFALAAGAGGFVLWVATLGAAPALAALGSLFGIGGMLVGLSAALASAIGRGTPEGREPGSLGSVAAQLAVLVPAVVSFLLLALVWN